MFVRMTSAIPCVGLGDEQLAQADDARELALVDDVDDVDELARARAPRCRTMSMASATRIRGETAT